MAHQCLQCGHLFPEGSSAILQGCPQCKGTRFFFTRQALTDGDRKAMADKAQRDLRDVVSDILKSGPADPDLQSKVAGLSSLRPADLRQLVKAAAAQAQPAAAAAGAVPAATGSPAPWPRMEFQEIVLKPRPEDRRAEVEAEMAKTAVASHHPDTVNIKRAGQYEIDVAALLAHNPIVVHKDGTYHIHLASLFDSTKQ